MGFPLFSCLDISFHPNPFKRLTCDITCGVLCESPPLSQTNTPLIYTSSMNQILLVTAVCILGAISANATCPSGQHSLCCMGVAQYSSNSGVWGDICGFFPPDNPLVGARCLDYSPSEGW